MFSRSSFCCGDVWLYYLVFWVVGLGKGCCKGNGMDTYDKMWALISSFFLFNEMTLRCLSRKRKRVSLGSSSILEERPFVVRVFPIIIAILSLFEPQPGCVW